MIKDSGLKKESTFVNRAQQALGVWGLAPMKKDSGPNKAG
jgi:hypothetical protein